MGRKGPRPIEPWMRPDVSETELAWAAGFFDGEGSTQSARRSPAARAYSPRARRIQIDIRQVDARPLRRFRAIFPFMRLLGPYSHNGPRASPYYALCASGVGRVREIIWRLWPYLSDVKRDQASAAAHRYYELGLVSSGG